jgi:RNA polymerase sigma-70 factor (ECF subfamily)
MSDRDRDHSCMNRLRAGDATALEELYDRHGGLLYSVVLKIVGRPAEAEDVLQEAWFQVWKRCETYDPSRGPVVAWLVTVAKSRAIDRYRSLAARQRAETSVAAVDPPAAPADPPATTAHRQLHERVTRALESLSAEQRQVLELAYFGGLSQSEVASRIGAPLGTVKSWTRQALLKLRDLVPREEWA